MMENILICYYSQTGQLKDILINMFSSLNANLEFCEIRAPQYTFPLNWRSMFEMFPESVLQMPCQISYDIPLKKFDKIVIGFQTWFLHLSLPMLSFIMTDDFKTLVNGKEVILVMDCRNSWRQSMKRIEDAVTENGGIVKNRYVFCSVSGNFWGSISILKWFFTGNKHTYFLPEPGVPDSEVLQAKRHGFEAVNKINDNVTLCPKTNARTMPPAIEEFAIQKFKWWAKYIVEGKSEYRRFKLFLFKVWLIFIIVIISPLVKILKK